MTSLITTGHVRGGSRSKNFQPRSFNMGISKEAFLKSGGFGKIHPGEDPDLSIRLKKAGFRTVLYENLKVFHKRRVSIKSFFKQVYKFGVARSILNHKFPDREKVAAQFEGEAQKILIVEKAKAEAESKRLQGQGIADQRREIARGLEDSVKVLNGVDINSQEASALIVVTQHYDTLQSVGAEANSNLILMPNSPQAGSEMLNNMVASFTASNQIGEEMKKARMQQKGKESK